MPQISFHSNLPLRLTMDFELVYHPNLQMDIASKQYLRDLPGSIFTWMYIDGALAGETYGIPLSACDEHLPGLTALSPAEKDAAFYCYSNTLLLAFQHRGFGAVLKKHWLSLVANAGFKIVYGHARPGGSQDLNASFGAVFLHTFSNWYGTQEDYKLYRHGLDVVPK